MGSFDANGADIKTPKDIGEGSATKEIHPFADLHKAMSSKPDKHQVAQAGDTSGMLGGKSEDQFVKKTAEDIRKQLHLGKDASAEDVFNKMGEDGYKYFLAHPKEQENALRESGLTRENISPETLTQSIIQQRRVEQNLPDAKLDELEKGDYKKLYNDLKDLKHHKERIDYD